MLRQQMEKENPDDPYLCQSDFVAPKETGVKDYMGVRRPTPLLFCFFRQLVLTRFLSQMFAVGVFGCEKLVAKYEAENDDYSKIMAQALADRFAEAFAEALHREIRADIWGYSPEETGKDVDAQELHQLHYQGIRPAPGYPSQPDHTEKRTMWDLMQVEAKTGIVLSDALAVRFRSVSCVVFQLATEPMVPLGQMMPAAAVSALVFGHNKSCYFNVGKVDKSQIVDYTERKVRPTTPPASPAWLPLAALRVCGFGRVTRWSRWRNGYNRTCPMTLPTHP